MKTNSANYLHEHSERVKSEFSNSLIQGCKAVLSERGTFRGGLGDLTFAIAKHVSLSAVLSVQVLGGQLENLRAQGVEVILHDDRGYDIELISL